MAKRDQAAQEDPKGAGPSEPSKPPEVAGAKEATEAKEAQKAPKAFVPTGRRFKVGRSFRAGGKMQPRGSIIGEQPWKNFNALVNVGYLIPIYADEGPKIMPMAGEGVADGT